MKIIYHCLFLSILFYFLWFLHLSCETKELENKIKIYEAQMKFQQEVISVYEKGCINKK